MAWHYPQQQTAVGVKILHHSASQVRAALRSTWLEQQAQTNNVQNANGKLVIRVIQNRIDQITEAYFCTSFRALISMDVMPQNQFFLFFPSFEDVSIQSGL